MSTAPAADLPAPRRPRWTLGLALLLGLLLLLISILMFFFSSEPDPFDPKARAETDLGRTELPTGYVTVTAVVGLIDVLLDKRGGYFSNDLLPPGAWMDNIPNFEFGVLVQLRDVSITLRDHFSRSQTQSADDADLREAQPLLASPNDRWLWPATEGQYAKARTHLLSYRTRLADDNRQDAQFYARADNLENWLSQVESRLGALSQRLSASVGQARVNTDLGGDAGASQSTPAQDALFVRTPWTEIDDNFYEARGQCYALLHLLHAVRVDFHATLERKNALVTLDQVIRELEATQSAIWSPMILNGGGYGFFANHSLVIANYVARASRGIGELRMLLRQG